MITDLFSHKIHSSREDWPYKLIDIASVFGEFDGLPYDRSSIEDRFRMISPRASEVARDPSKYRDEISAYPAYLGLYKMQREGTQWILRLSETAKQFLIGEEPNVPAFMIMQLLLFQYPNGNGATFNNKSGTVSLKPNAANKTLGFIKEGIHLSPLRLICTALLADSVLNGIDSLHPRVTIDEIGILANDKRVNTVASPSLETVLQVLNEARQGIIQNVRPFERRFHILNHTDFIQVTNGCIHLRETFSPEDSNRLIKLLNAISTVKLQYDGFDNCKNKNELEEVIREEGWGTYFDGMSVLTADVVKLITNESFIQSEFPNVDEVREADDIILDNKALKFKYPLRERDSISPINFDFNSVTNSPIKADPEVTRIKRQRSNLQHKIITSKLDEYLRSLGATPYENEHIDMFARLPDNGTFLFEIKSTTSENLLSQTRKGLSQLYEYHYRYKSDIGSGAILCLVYPSEPKEIEWLQDYLCNDREIAVCWFDNEKFISNTNCENRIGNLISK